MWLPTFPSRRRTPNFGCQKHVADLCVDHSAYFCVVMLRPWIINGMTTTFFAPATATCGEAEPRKTRVHSAPQSQTQRNFPKRWTSSLSPQTGPEASQTSQRDQGALLRPETHPTGSRGVRPLLRPFPPLDSGLADPAGSPTPKPTTKFVIVLGPLFDVAGDYLVRCTTRLRRVTSTPSPLRRSVAQSVRWLVGGGSGP